MGKLKDYVSIKLKSKKKWSIQVLLLKSTSMLPKYFSFLQLRTCSSLLKNYKIPIFNAAMAIKTIVSVKQFLRNFPITFSKRSMFTFIIIKPITKFGFRFPNLGDFTTNFTFEQIENFFGITCQGTTLNFKHFLTDVCCEGRSSNYRVPN